MSLISSIFYALSLIPLYLIGCIPTGRLVALKQGIRIEECGSGNVGATNVARSVGKKAGILTLAFDIFKGAFAVFMADLLSGASLYAGIAGIAVVAGHCFSIPGKLKGGKGVATALGALLSLHPLAALVGMAIFVIVFSLSQIVSLASVCAALGVPLAGIFLGVEDGLLLTIFIIALIVVARHKENLVRLTEGRESKFSFKKQEDAGDGGLALDARGSQGNPE